MRRILYWLTTICLGLIAGSFLLSTEVNAQNACETSEMNCSQLDYQGGCTNPCIRVVTRQGTPGRPGVPAQCACQTPINTPGTVPLGGSCQQNTDCVSTAPYCYGGFNMTPTCHTSQNSNPGQQQEEVQAKKICEFSGDQQAACETCVDQSGVYTAFGCIKTNAQDFVSALLRIAISVAGGIALLMIIYGGFQIMTSSGNPERLTGGKEIITSAIAGLLLIVFSVVILKIVGVDILGIPGL